MHIFPSFIHLLRNYITRPLHITFFHSYWASLFSRCNLIFFFISWSLYIFVLILTIIICIINLMIISYTAVILYLTYTLLIIASIVAIIKCNNYEHKLILLSLSYWLYYMSFWVIELIRLLWKSIYYSLYLLTYLLTCWCLLLYPSI